MLKQVIYKIFLILFLTFLGPFFSVFNFLDFLFTFFNRFQSSALSTFFFFNFFFAFSVSCFFSLLTPFSFSLFYTFLHTFFFVAIKITCLSTAKFLGFFPKCSCFFYLNSSFKQCRMSF